VASAVLARELVVERGISKAPSGSGAGQRCTCHICSRCSRV